MAAFKLSCTYCTLRHPCLCRFRQYCVFICPTWLHWESRSCTRDDAHCLGCPVNRGPYPFATPPPPVAPSALSPWLASLFEPRSHPASRGLGHPPAEIRQNIVQLYQTKLGHYGMVMCCQILGEHYWWQGMKTLLLSSGAETPVKDTSFVWQIPPWRQGE
jgi:hypothetical protein